MLFYLRKDEKCELLDLHLFSLPTLLNFEWQANEMLQLLHLRCVENMHKAISSTNPAIYDLSVSTPPYILQDILKTYYTHQ